MMNRSIWINTEFNATHCWPECPIDEVEYLRHEHRHTFKVKVQLEVIHNDRDVEFIVFKNFIKGIYCFTDIRRKIKACVGYVL